jgi:protein-tyrosine phosphatase
VTRLLVVCTANLVRSPFAAAALTRSIPRYYTIDSAGLAAAEGEEIPSDVLQDMRRYVLDLSKHRSRQVTQSDVRRSALILGMTEAHRDALQTMVPAATPRTFTFTEFVRLAENVPRLSEHDGVDTFVAAVHRQRPRTEAAVAREDIDDPLGRSAGRMRACIDELADLAERMGARFH